MYKKILFPLDIADENSWNTALPQVTDLVRRFGCDLHIMTVVPDYGISIVKQYFPKGWVEDMEQKALAQLKEIAAKHVAADVNVEYAVGRGAVYQSILETGEDLGVDLIVLMATGIKERDYLLGPNAAKVVRHSTVSVLVVRDPAKTQFLPS